MKKMKVNSAVVLYGALFSGGVIGAIHGDAVIDTLFEQANYWHEKSNDALACESLKKVLMVDGNNTQALYLMALWAEQRGDLKTADEWRSRLSRVSPDKTAIEALNNARQRARLPQGTLKLARQQAQSGNIAQALNTWKTLFNGDSPPAGLEAEYYLTKGSDRSLYSQALAELQRFSDYHPQDHEARLALGKMLTWREETRRAGIDWLYKMAGDTKDADVALRQALLWLEPKPEDEPLYRRWLDAHPHDSEVEAYYRRNVGGMEKGDGFTALNSGNTAAARRQFERVLQASPEDADALAGMGYVALRSGDYSAAAKYLLRAASMGGKASDERQAQAEDALFYGELSRAQQALKEGDITLALSLSAPLAEQAGERGASAKLFRADALRKSKKYEQAEQILRELLNSQPQNAHARENLYYVLKDQNKTDEAQAILRSLPPGLQKTLQHSGFYRSPGDRVRRQAMLAAEGGDTRLAISILRDGLSRMPDDPWMRLDLARLLLKSGENAEATSLMEQASLPGAGASSLFAAALYASEKGAWQHSQRLLSRISPASQTAEMRELSRRVNLNLQLATAELYLSQGNTLAASNTLKTLFSRPPESPVDAGRFALLLARSGDMSSAVTVVRRSLAEGVKGNAGDYAGQITVLNEAGLTDEAERFLSSPELISRSTSAQLSGVQNSYVINQADRLREQGNYAAAYDRLIRALQSDPQNTDLMFAMARLYQTGRMNKEAGVVYDYLLMRDTPEQDARIGAINIALAENNVSEAKHLANGLQPSTSPQRLLLLARLEEAQGQHQQAMTYLRSARAKLTGLATADNAAGPMAGGRLLADNPFITTRQTSQNAQKADSGGYVFPWQQARTADNRNQTLYVPVRTDEPQAAPEDRTLREVDELIRSVREQTGTWQQAGVEIRARNGESGTSKLTEAKVPLTWSGVPSEGPRFEFSATPVTLSSGSASGETWQRFGSNPLVTGNTTGAVSAESQNANGVELSAALSGKDYRIDVGSTPLGQKLDTLTGGVKWSSELSGYLSLILTGERRAVTDSMLSYVGLEDKRTGRRWGRVTRNGGNMQLSYDDGDAGLYAGGGAYRYTGESVAGNASVNGEAGFYFRPYHDDIHQLKAGLSMSWMDFTKNLSQFTFGQGGYFSPQNYVSVSLPVEYTRKMDNWTLRLGGAAGYQSYSQDSSEYFPTNHEWQQLLEEAADKGEISESRYAGRTEGGAGFTARAGLDYKVNRDITIGGKLGYDTFGSYNESTAGIYFRYMSGDW